MIMRLGLQRKHLPDLKSIWRQVPSIWQYAHEAGFKTVMIDGFRSLGSYHSYMSAAEARAIDVTIPETGMPEYDRDARIAETLT